MVCSLAPVLGRGRESPRGNPDSQSQEPCQRVVAVVRAPANQPIWMFVAAKGAEAHQHSEWTVKKIARVRSLARAVQRRATVTLDMAEQYPNKSFWVSYVAVPRKHLGLEECIELSAHVLVARRNAGSVKCTKCLQVCVNKHPRFWLPTARTRWQAKNTPFHPAAPGFT